MGTRLIVNPSAGAGRAGLRLRDARARIDAIWPDAEWCESRSGEHVTELAREAVDRGFARVLVAGGDGTVHFAANGVAGTDTALGILPVGTGNDIANSVGIPSQLGRALDLLAEDRVTPIDVGQVGDRLFCCVLGVGMDTPALEIINNSRLRRGRLLYTYAAVRTMLSYRPQPMEIRCSGQLTYAGPVMFCAVSNTPTYGGGMRIAPEALLSDGRLDLAVFPARSRLGLLTSFGRMMRGVHGARDGILFAQDRTIEIESETPLPVTLDGELTQLTTSLVARVLPGALRLLGAPPPSPLTLSAAAAA